MERWRFRRYDLATLTPAQGFKILGVAGGDNAGCSVSIAGDVNGDGIDDLIIGANAADPGDRYNAGQAYLVYGKQGGLSEVDLGAQTSEQGFKLSGAIANDFSGLSVSGGGDINGDGFGDLIVGAVYAGNRSGNSYVVYGGDFTKSVSNLGTAGDDTLTGAAVARPLSAASATTCSATLSVMPTPFMAAPATM